MNIHSILHIIYTGNWYPRAIILQGPGQALTPHNLIDWETLVLLFRAKITPMEQIIYMYFVFSIEWHIKWWRNIVVVYMDVNRKPNIIKFILAKQFPQLKNIINREAIRNVSRLGLVSLCSNMRQHQRHIKYPPWSRHAVHWPQGGYLTSLTDPQKGSCNWQGCYHRSRNMAGIVQIIQGITIIHIYVFHRINNPKTINTLTNN